MRFAPVGRTVSIYTSPMTKTGETVTIKAVEILGVAALFRRTGDS
jgi:hypothetical protein